MLQLHYANYFENLLGPLAQAVELHQRRDPLATLRIIVPSRAVEQFAKYGIAERLGVAANLAFPFLRRYLAGIAEQADPGIRVLEVPQLQVTLFECLRSEAHRDHHALRAVREYLTAANPANDALGELRLFELAGRIAQLFQEYSISRSAMLGAWNSPNSPPSSDEELWQRTLWTMVFDREGAARAPWAFDGAHRWMLLPQALAAIPDNRLRDVLPPALHIFGLASPGRVFLEIFARMGRLADLLVYAVNPCMEFWEDVDDSAAARASTWHHRTEKVGAALEDGEDPFDLATPSESRALQLWGRPGREYIRMLNELTQCDFQPHFTHATGASLLARLQEDILVRAGGPPGDRKTTPEPRPGSIRLIGAPGLRREVEIIANEILRVVSDADGSGNSPLRFHEVAVLVPDAVADAYLPEIESVFASQFGIPVEIDGRRFYQSRAAEAIALLLKFPLARATRAELLRLLTHPVIAGTRGELDTDRLSAWCEELGVFFGIDASDLADTYVPANLFQWDQALTRITLGAFMEGGGQTEGHNLYHSESGALLPLTLLQEEVPAAARFLKTARTLLADTREIRSHRLSLSDWAALLAELIGTYVQAGDPEDQSFRDQCLEILQAMGSLTTGAVGYEVAHSFLSASLSERAARQGGFSRRGVAAGSLGTLRALPFRAIFVVGMNEATFPERDRRDPTDLRLARRHPGDISPPERDRYLFLESLLAARARIAFSWVERDAQTGDRLEPSTTVRELQSILQGYLDGPQQLGELTTSHPVSSYDPDYFPDLASVPRPDSSAAGDLVSFDPAARRGARMRRVREQLALGARDQILPARAALLESLGVDLRTRLAGSLGLFELPAKSVLTANELDLPLAAVRRFLECPLQGAARYALGMVEEDGAPDDASDEPIALSRLDHALILRQAFWSARGKPELFTDAYREAIATAQMRGAAPAGPFAEAAIEADCERFARWCGELDAKRRDLGEWRVFRMGRGTESSRADRVLPPLRLEVCTTDRAGRALVRKVNLHGSLGALSPALDCSLRLVTRSKPKPQDFLELFIAAIALSAAGEPVARRFEAWVLGDPAPTSSKAAFWSRALRTPMPDAALEYLAQLVGEMITRAHDYFLPIEAVAAARRAIRDGKDALDRIDNIREGLGSCASDYGPVRNARDYEPPDEPEVASIIGRRFGPVDAIFENQDDG
ncbi:MAG: exodeoxyribonuclease V subunit gamma [Deltaproteobacteria bacterium]|nr:exodeoxyribonuclease V subunit gamma [Deltaproteobacteria bacterium]